MGTDICPYLSNSSLVNFIENKALKVTYKVTYLWKSLFFGYFQHHDFTHFSIKSIICLVGCLCLPPGNTYVTVSSLELISENNFFSFLIKSALVPTDGMGDYNQNVTVASRCRLLRVVPNKHSRRCPEASTSCLAELILEVQFILPCYRASGFTAGVWNTHSDNIYTMKAMARICNLGGEYKKLSVWFLFRTNIRHNRSDNKDRDM